MFCQSCGQEMGESDKFCQACGAANIVSPMDPPISNQFEYNYGQPEQQMGPDYTPQYYGQVPQYGAPVMTEKKKSGKGIIIALIVILVAIALGVGGFFAYRVKTVKDNLDLGEKYIKEQDYEAAVAALTAAYKIDPKNEEVQDSLVSAYVDWSDYLITEESDYEKAAEVLREGYELLDNKRLKRQLNEVKEDLKRVEEVQDVLDRVAQLCQLEEYDEVFEFLHSDEYYNLIDNVDVFKSDYRYKTEYGNIGIYFVDTENFGDYMIYYGDYEGEERSGYGVWIGYYEGNNYLGQGQWANDKPNGDFKVKEFATGLVNMDYRVIECNVTDGLWDGSYTWSFIKGSDTTTYRGNLDMGKFVVVEYRDYGSGKRPVVGYGENDSYMYTEDENEIEGVVGFGADL